MDCWNLGDEKHFLSKVVNSQLVIFLNRICRAKALKIYYS